jgi:hypothetical protein
VGSNAWYRPDVDFVVEKGIMDGTGPAAFSPDTFMTRGMLVTMLWRMAGKPAAGAACPFTDVASGAYYASAVAWAYEKGVVNGVGGGRFAPDDAVTREQLAAILFRYASVMGRDTTQGGMAAREFSDFESVSAYAAPAMQWAVNAGLIKGAGNLLMPRAGTSRAQAAAVLHRFSA